MLPRRPERAPVGRALLALLCCLLPGWLQAAANGFAGGVTPSRFELRADAGTVLRRALDIYNLSDRPQRYQIRTVDWRYSEDGQISFQDALAANSCREWVRLERHEVGVVPDPKQPRSFRFEVHVPEDSPPRECRLALMIENRTATYAAEFADGSISMPIAGRIAVIVYLGIGAVEPELQIGDVSVQPFAQGTLPALAVRNLGTAHGRLDSDLTAIGPDGKRVPVTIATSPILPGQTRQLALTPAPGTALQYPLTITGRIYSDGKSIAIDQDVAEPDQGLIASQ